MKNKINFFLCFGILYVVFVEAKQNLPAKTSPDSLATVQKEVFVKAEQYGLIKNDFFNDIRQNIGIRET